MPYYKINIDLCISESIDTAEYDTEEEARENALSYIEDCLKDNAKNLSEDADIEIRESGRREISEYLEGERRFEEMLKKQKSE